jgi:hypothetical protein
MKYYGYFSHNVKVFLLRYWYEFLFIHNAPMDLNEYFRCGIAAFDDPNDALNLFAILILMPQCPYKCLKFIWYIVASMTLMMPWIYFWYWYLYDPTDALNLLAILMPHWHYWILMPWILMAHWSYCLEFSFDIDAWMTLMIPWIYLLYGCLDDPNDALNLHMILIPPWSIMNTLLKCQSCLILILKWFFIHSYCLDGPYWSIMNT